MVMPGGDWGGGAGYGGGPTPEEVYRGLTEANRRALWVEAAMAYVRQGELPATAAARADEFLALYDLRNLNRDTLKDTFGKDGD